MKKFICIFSLLIIILSGCDLLTNYIPDEDLKISYSRNAGDYLYSNKVLLHLSCRYNDNLQLKINDNTYKTILEGLFDRVAHKDNYLFIETKEAYYVFDIDSYTPPKDLSLLEEADIKYIIIKYSVNDFKTEYPLYESFKWFNF